MKRRLILLVLVLWWPLSALVAHQTESITQESLKQNFCHVLDGLKNEFSTYYGPREWKKEHLGWDLDAAIADAKFRILALGSTDRCDYQAIIVDFFNSMQDYHVGVYFTNFDYSFLPFDVITVEGRTFISYINWEFVSSEVFDFAIGDEILEFDGQPINDVLMGLEGTIGGSNPDSNRGLADKLLTIRPGRIGMRVPKGPVSVTIHSQSDDSIHDIQLAWACRESFYSQEPCVTEGMLSLAEKGPRHLPTDEEMRQLHCKRLARFLNPDMQLPLYRSLEKAVRERGDAENNPFSLGSVDSILPDLGEVIWTFEAAEMERSDVLSLESFGNLGDRGCCACELETPFQAYLYLNEEGRTIGFVRIPWYTGSSYDARCFAYIIDKVEQEADALVIDQMFNPGGDVFYCYALASMLATQALDNAQDQWCLNDCDYFWAKFNQFFLEGITSDEQAKNALGDSWYGYPMGFQTAQLFLNYLNNIVESWENGVVLTKPTYLGMIDRINPNPWNRFTKPILVLINHMDFSCGDHFPMLMQDNGRAVLMGTRTAGAGGCVVGGALGYANYTGLDCFRITNSLAWRPSGMPYEDLGITPDIDYAMTVEDLQDGFAPMAAQVNAEVTKLLPVEAE